MSSRKYTVGDLIKELEELDQDLVVCTEDRDYGELYATGVRVITMDQNSWNGGDGPLKGDTVAVIL